MYAVIDNVEKLVASVSEVTETKIALLKLKAADKISTALSGFVSIILAAVFGSMAIIILSIGFAFLIGDQLNNLSYGFFLIGIFYALIGLLVYINRKKWVQIPISNLLINKILQ